MFFNVDMDNGHEIVGWLAPDNPTASPKLIVQIPGREDIHLTSDVPRPDVSHAGLHTTGRVGFKLDETNVVAIDSVVDLTIRDADNDVAIYRRPQPGIFIERKLFVFDASITSQLTLKKDVESLFALTYFNSDRISLETLIVLLNNSRVPSILACGASNYLRYSQHLHQNGFLKAALLRDPFEELAERLLILKVAAKLPDSGRSVVQQGLEPLLPLAQEMQFDDQRSMLNAFRRLSAEQKDAIRSPMTKMLGCLPKEDARRTHVGSALENLAGMDVVGTRNRYELFWEMLRAALGFPIGEFTQPATFRQTKDVGEKLARVGVVADLLDMDLALFSFVEEAIQQSTDDPDQAGLLKRNVHIR
jgi:hypothetical protein